MPVLARADAPIADPGFAFVDVDGDGLYGSKDVQVDLPVLAADGLFDTQQSEPGYRARRRAAGLVVPPSVYCQIPAAAVLRAGRSITIGGTVEAPGLALVAGEDIAIGGVLSATDLLKIAPDGAFSATGAAISAGAIDIRGGTSLTLGENTVLSGSNGIWIECDRGDITGAASSDTGVAPSMYSDYDVDVIGGHRVAMPGVVIYGLNVTITSGQPWHWGHHHGGGCGGDHHGCCSVASKGVGVACETGGGSGGGSNPGCGGGGDWGWPGGDWGCPGDGGQHGDDPGCAPSFGIDLVGATIVSYADLAITCGEPAHCGHHGGCGGNHGGCFSASRSAVGTLCETGGGSGGGSNPGCGGGGDWGWPGGDWGCPGGDWGGPGHPGHHGHHASYAIDLTSAYLTSSGSLLVDAGWGSVTMDSAGLSVTGSANIEGANGISANTSFAMADTLTVSTFEDLSATACSWLTNGDIVVEAGGDITVTGGYFQSANPGAISVSAGGNISADSSQWYGDPVGLNADGGTISVNGTVFAVVPTFNPTGVNVIGYVAP